MSILSASVASTALPPISVLWIYPAGRLPKAAALLFVDVVEKPLKFKASPAPHHSHLEALLRSVPMARGLLELLPHTLHGQICGH